MSEQYPDDALRMIRNAMDEIHKRDELLRRAVLLLADAEKHSKQGTKDWSYVYNKHWQAKHYHWLKDYAEASGGGNEGAE